MDFHASALCNLIDCGTIQFPKGECTTAISSWNTIWTSGGSEFHGAAITRISSVSKFFEANPEAVNLQLKCRRVLISRLRIWDCTE
jgi:hypothetical protein